MPWITIKEYIKQRGVSDSTVRRYIRAKKIRAKRIGAKWFVWSEETIKVETMPSGVASEQIEPELPEESKLKFPESYISKDTWGSIAEVISFSSKALNSYLMMSDRLISEKEKRIEEKDSIIKDQKQQIIELESYVKLLEQMERSIRKLKEKL